MGEGKFTPGPWVVKKDEWGISVQCRYSVPGLPFAVTPICEIEQEEDTGGIEDAQLIAAAPEMYTALSAFSDAIKVGGKDELREALEMARAALAKAEGRDA